MKLAGIPTLAILLLCFSLTLMILLVFCFSPSVSQHHSFLGSTYELIMKAKSSPVFMFCICNLIVVTVLPGSLRPSDGEFDSFVSLLLAEHVKEEEKGEEMVEEEEEEEEEDFHGYDGYDEDNDDNGSEDVDTDSEDEGGDDLNRKIEEFIAKINREWREERLREKLIYIGAIQPYGYEV